MREGILSVDWNRCSQKWDVTISEKLCNILYKDMKWQAHHIQVLLGDELSQCKEKYIITVNKHVKTL